MDLDEAGLEGLDPERVADSNITAPSADYHGALYAPHPTH
jgi:hypothetical protein